MKKSLTFITSTVVVLSAPFAVFAQNLGYVNTFVTQIKGVVALLPSLLVGLAVVLFSWGLVKFLLAAGDDKAREEAKSLMVWGLIAILVMVSIWGIVALLQGVFNIGGGGALTPAIPA
jgi:hypothetical protein